MALDNPSNYHLQGAGEEDAHAWHSVIDKSTGKQSKHEVPAAHSQLATAVSLPNPSLCHHLTRAWKHSALSLTLHEH